MTITVQTNYGTLTFDGYTAGAVATAGVAYLCAGPLAAFIPASVKQSLGPLGKLLDFAAWNVANAKNAVDEQGKDTPAPK